MRVGPGEKYQNGAAIKEREKMFWNDGDSCAVV